VVVLPNARLAEAFLKEEARTGGDLGPYALGRANSLAARKFQGKRNDENPASLFDGENDGVPK
jgi:hypothetical protein